MRMRLSRDAKVLVVVFVEKVENLTVRIISARKATRSEEERYNGK